MSNWVWVLGVFGAQIEILTIEMSSMPTSAPVPNGDRTQICNGDFMQLTGAEQFGTGLTSTSCSSTCHWVVSTVDVAASDTCFEMRTRHRGWRVDESHWRAGQGEPDRRVGRED